MHTHSELLYTDKEKIIVKVSGWNGDKEIGSALAEGLTVEIAEDKAIKRLTDRISEDYNLKYKTVNNNPDSQESKELNHQKPNNIDIKSKQELKKLSLPTSIPKDWTDELFSYENELKRLSIDKKEEIKIINMILEVTNRSMITEYNDIVLLTNLLKSIPDKTNITEIVRSLDRDNLIKENNNILVKLKLDTESARQYLIKNFNKVSRSELNNKQLVMFNLMLESNF